MFSLHPLLSEVCLLLHSSGGFCTIVSSVDENNTWNAKGHRREQAFFLEMQVYEWIQLLRVNIRVKITLHTRFCFSLVMTDDCTDKQRKY